MFYVGQKIVAIKDHSEFAFKKGDEFIVLDIKLTPCCKEQILDIGKTKGSDYSYCVKCDNLYRDWSNVWAFKHYMFAPLEEYSDSMSIAMQLVQEIDQTDKQKVFNPKRETVEN